MSDQNQPGGDAGQQGPQTDQPPQYVQVPGNGAATAAMVLGIVGAVLALIPIFGLIAFPMGVLAIIFGVVGLRKHGKETPKGKGAAITGIVLGLLSFVLAIVGMNIVGGAIDDMDDAITEFEQEMEDL